MLNIFFIIIYAFFIYIKNGYTKEFNIKNGEPNFINLNTLVNSNQDKNELIINFVDDYYDMTKLSYTIDFVVDSNITFRGKKDGTTIFNYGNFKRGRFVFAIPNNSGNVIKIENIIFEEFDSKGEIGLDILLFMPSTDNYYAYINNCIFRNNNYRIMRIELNYDKPSHEDPSVVFKNCDF